MKLFSSNKNNSNQYDDIGSSQLNEPLITDAVIPKYVMIDTPDSRTILNRMDLINFIGDNIIEKHIYHGLASFEIPHRTTSIERDTFYGSHIETLILSPQLEEIDLYQFSACINLKKIVFPKIAYDRVKQNYNMSEKKFSEQNGYLSVILHNCRFGIGFDSDFTEDNFQGSSKDEIIVDGNKFIVFTRETIPQEAIDYFTSELLI